LVGYSEYFAQADMLTRSFQFSVLSSQFFCFT
jgi:hypothetical protein